MHIAIITKKLLPQSLTINSGADRSMITVFIDGFHEEPLAVTKLFGLRGVQHSPSGDKNARISQVEISEFKYLSRNKMKF